MNVSQVQYASGKMIPASKFGKDDASTQKLELTMDEIKMGESLKVSGTKKRKKLSRSRKGICLTGGTSLYKEFDDGGEETGQREGKTKGMGAQKVSGRESSNVIAMFNSQFSHKVC